ncbi:MAG TPA: helix-turn-helix transcriptional regulator [Gemmatimonadaceae bacterium]|nr:helix-turn-helix transcriptional regulator [Gemmatimonadaceae bacterium]
MRTVLTWNAAISAAQRGDVRLVIVGLRMCDDGSLAECRRFRDEFPAIPLVAYGGDRPAEIRSLAALGTIGVCAVLIAGVDDVSPSHLAALVRSQLLKSRSPEALLAWLLPAMPLVIRPVIEFVVTRTPDVRTVNDVAAACGVHPRALRRRLQSAHLPAPDTLIKLCRLAHVALLLEDGEVSVETAARRVGYESTRTLRKQCTRLLGVTPRQLARGGLERVAGVLRDACRAIPANQATHAAPPPVADETTAA